MLSDVPKNETGMFRGEREGRKQQTKGVIYALLGSFCFLATIWCFLFSGWFDVKKYEISDLRVLSREAVIGEVEGFIGKSRSWPWGNRNIFFVDVKELENYLMRELYIQGATVDKTCPNILRLKIWERQRSVILITNNNFYIVDDYGVVTDLADNATVSSTKKFLTSSTPIETSKEIYVYMSTSTQFVKGQELIKSNRARGLLDVAAKLRDAGIWFKALEFKLEDPEALNVVLRQDKRVMFDLGDSLDAQIETLRSFIASKPKWEEINEYIDVRVPGRIYYK